MSEEEEVEKVSNPIVASIDAAGQSVLLMVLLLLSPLSTTTKSIFMGSDTHTHTHTSLAPFQEEEAKFKIASQLGQTGARERGKIGVQILLHLLLSAVLP